MVWEEEERDDMSSNDGMGEVIKVAKKGREEEVQQRGYSDVEKERGYESEEVEDV